MAFNLLSCDTDSIKSFLDEETTVSEKTGEESTDIESERLEEIAESDNKDIDNIQSTEIETESISNQQETEETTTENTKDISKTNKDESLDDKIINGEFSISDVPDYKGFIYVEINNNKPFFTTSYENGYESYSDFDNLGRCGTAWATIGIETMPTEKRGEIGHIKPSGWHTVKYPDLIEDRYLYNRCHLLGYQLSGENANEKNLITGTRYFNVEGMLPFENMVADYIKRTDNHVF